MIELLQSLISPSNLVAYLWLIVLGCVSRGITLVIYAYLDSLFDFGVMPWDWWKECCITAAMTTIIILATATVKVVPDSLLAVLAGKAFLTAIVFGFSFYGGAIAQDIHDRISK